MTQTVMEPDDSGANLVAPIVVLTLNTGSTVQGYIKPVNEVLQSLLGQNLWRVDARIETWQFDLRAAKRSKLDLLLTARDMSLNQLEKLLETDEWLIEKVRQFIVALLPLGSNACAADIRTVLILESLLDDAMSLRRALQPFLPNATFFCVNHDRSYLPVRIWETPLCMTCGTDMSKAGKDVYVCTGCGSASGFSG